MPDEVNSNPSNSTSTETVQPETVQIVGGPNTTPETIPPAQEPNASTPSTSTSSEMPPEAPESPRNDSVSESSNIPENTAVNKGETDKMAENIGSSEPQIQTAPVPIEASAGKPVMPESPTQTAQIPPNEPLPATPEPIVTEAKPEPAKEEPKEVVAAAAVAVPVVNSKFRELFAKARQVIQIRKRKKLDRIMTLFLKKSQITNDDVEKLLHVSDATAGRYLSTLEKENKIKQTGKTGTKVSYSRL